MAYVVMTPAYGRDYKTAKEVKDAWAKGLDFQCQPSGQYINKQDAAVAGLKVNIRFAGLRKMVVI